MDNLHTTIHLCFVNHILKTGIQDRNTNTMDLVTRDLEYLWHPCSQMQDYEKFLPLHVVNAHGPYLELADGRLIIDAISSWWCKALGHGHPRLKDALIKQIHSFEHVILANTTNTTIVDLSEKLASLTKTLKKVFYASDGSSAIEIALKMSLHARQIQGQPQRNRYVALTNGYHGETLFALSVSDLGLYKQPYQNIVVDTLFIRDLPYVSGIDDPLWQDCGDYWWRIEAQLNQHADTITAIIIEPVVQGVGGMLIYSQDFLCRLRMWAHAHDIHLIADEIMTGLGRTGTALACNHAGIEPDFLCLGKGLTGGFLPLSAVLMTPTIYDLFYADYALGRSFLHSHTFSGNALAASVALECLQVLEEENIYARVQTNASYMRTLMQQLADETGKLTNVRGIGAIVAADLVVTNQQDRIGYQVYQHAVKYGALLRPLGNTICWLPPLNINNSVLTELQTITRRAIMAVLG